MKASTKQTALEKTKAALEKTREKEKELIQKAKSIQRSIENKERAKAKKKRTHTLILLGEFCDRILSNNTNFINYIENALIKVLTTLELQKKEELSEQDEKNIKKTEKMINDCKVIQEWITTKKN